MFFVYTFQSLGNHEFDDGVNNVQSFIGNITVPVVACNLDLTNEPLLGNEPNLMKSKVLTVNGRKIGIIGYLTPETTVSKYNLVNHNYPMFKKTYTLYFLILSLFVYTCSTFQGRGMLKYYRKFLQSQMKRNVLKMKE